MSQQQTKYNSAKNKSKKMKQNYHPIQKSLHQINCQVIKEPLSDKLKPFILENKQKQLQRPISSIQTPYIDEHKTHVKQLQTTIIELNKQLNQHKDLISQIQYKFQQLTQVKNTLVNNQRILKNDIKSVLRFAQIMKNNILDYKSATKFNQSDQRQYRALIKSYLENNQNDKRDQNLVKPQLQPKPSIEKLSYFLHLQDFNLYNEKLTFRKLQDNYSTQLIQTLKLQNDQIKRQLFQANKQLIFLTKQNHLLKQRSSNYNHLKNLNQSQQKLITRLQIQLQEKNTEITRLINQKQNLMIQQYDNDYIDTQQKQKTQLIKNKFIQHFKSKQKNQNYSSSSLSKNSHFHEAQRKYYNYLSSNNSQASQNFQ